MSQNNERHVYAVIGANYGDEGKGLATDAIAARLMAARLDPLVVRSNGGAQAGHSVETPDGLLHVFHHFGAGTLSGARTHLSRFFVAHPILFFRELTDLQYAMAVSWPEVTIDPRAPVTTPWDMFINQALEMSRGAGRHGSCGLGFGETLERTERGPGLYASDLDQNVLPLKLARIRDNWFVDRLTELGIAGHPDVLSRQDILFSDGILLNFLEDCRVFAQMARLRDDADLGCEKSMIFEGAQGLMLDQDLGDMPHVTRSRTGLPNIIAIAEEAGIDEIRPVYMTRAYLTRHGAGPLAGEVPDLAFATVIDPTNRPNDWQGSLRLAPLDLNLLCDFIHRDLARAKTSAVRIVPGIGITCLDQITGHAKIRRDGDILRLRAADLPSAISSKTGLQTVLTSRGPRRSDVALHMDMPEQDIQASSKKKGKKRTDLLESALYQQMDLRREARQRDRDALYEISRNEATIENSP